jgi:phage/plasmid primase-like uncharacterized protein
MSTWTLQKNPAWAGLNPDDGVYEPDCHDRSHMVDVICQCGEMMHIHETQIAGQKRAQIGARCQGCGEVLLFEPGELHRAFAELRKQGWIR